MLGESCRERTLLNISSGGDKKTFEDLLKIYLSLGEFTETIGRKL